MNATITAVVLFIVLTLAYFIFKTILGRNMKQPITIIYYLLIVLTQFYSAYQISKNDCGTPQVMKIFIWGIIPWVIIFFGLNVVLLMFPGWKAPFSNTFGYLITRLFGIRNVFNELLKSDFNTNDKDLNKMMEEIYEDQSLLINQFTPDNFDTAIQKLDKLWNKTSEGFQKNMEKLKFLINLKDDISRFIWYILTGILTISISSMGLLSGECKKSKEQIKDEVEEYKKQLAEREKQEKGKKQRIYNIRE